MPYLCFVLKAYRYRLAPTPAQTELLNQHIGAVRFLYNLALDCWTASSRRIPAPVNI